MLTYLEDNLGVERWGIRIPPDCEIPVMLALVAHHLDDYSEYVHEGHKTAAMLSLRDLREMFVSLRDDPMVYNLFRNHFDRQLRRLGIEEAIDPDLPFI